MSEELFEKYMLGSLSEPEKRRLSSILSEAEGKQAFVEFVQEWSLFGEVSRQKAAAGSGNRIRPRVRPVASRSSRRWWGVGLAASALFMVGLVLLLNRPAPPDVPETVVRGSRIAPPLPEPEVSPVPEPEPEPEPKKLRPVPAPKRPDPMPVPKLVPSPTPQKPFPVPKPEIAPRPKPPTPSRNTPTIVAMAEVVRVEGDVRVVTIKGEVPATRGYSLLPDQGIRTGVAGRAVFRFPDFTMIEVAPLTTLSRISDHRDAAWNEKGKTLFLLSGSLTADVVRQPTGKPLLLRTAVAEATVLGTKLTLTAETEAARLDVWKGRVRLRRLSDGASTLVTSGHRGIVAEGVALRSQIMVLKKDFQDGAAPDEAYMGTRDTHLSEVKQDLNVGREDELEADGDETDGKGIWALLRWDVSSLPRDAVIHSAVITLNVRGTSQSIGYRIHSMRRAWSEAETTWKLAADGVPWRRAGAQGSVDRGRQTLAAFAPRQRGEIMILLNREGVNMVQSWVRSPDSNHGVIIGSTASSDGFKFDSREASRASVRPKLTVNYTIRTRR